MPGRTILFGQDIYLSLEPVSFEASDLVVPKSVTNIEST